MSIQRLYFLSAFFLKIKICEVIVLLPKKILSLIDRIKLIYHILKQRCKIFIFTKKKNNRLK